MLNKIAISIYEVVGSTFCVTSDDGQRVYERISKALEQECEVALLFRNVNVLTSAFLNTAIGQLYGKFDWCFLRSKLSVEEIDQGDLKLLKWVIDSAKQYYRDPDGLYRAIQDELDEESNHAQD